MKKTALFVSFLLISLNATSQIRHEWATWGLKGHVKSTEEKLYDRTAQGAEEKLLTVTTRNYNAAGKIVDDINEDITSRFSYGNKMLYQYDDKGQLKSYESRYVHSDKLVGVFLCSYSHGGRQMKIIEKDVDGQIWGTEIRKHNNLGKEIERVQIYDTSQQKTEFIYNAKGVKTGERRDFTHGYDGSTRPEKEEFICDSAGNLIQVNGFCNAWVNIIEKWVYVSFDTKGNWTKCIYSSDAFETRADMHLAASKELYTIIRKIEYY